MGRRVPQDLLAIDAMAWAPAAADACGRSLLDLPSRASRELLRELRRVAAHDSVNVCLVGPSGTGKTLYAEEVHRCSPRAHGPFVKINLASIDSGLAGSELLGHVEGAFTGARARRMGGLLTASGGTLVLDEITKAPISVQHILLHLFDRDPVRPVGSDRAIVADVRFVALTSTSLEQAVSRGALIPDLYERLKTFVLEITPLSERRVDIPSVLLAAVRRHATRFGYVTPPLVEEAVVRELERRPLTGNHRELDGLAQRMLVNAEGAPVLRLEHMPGRTVTESASLRSRRARWLEDRHAAHPPSFPTVGDEARFYGVSLATMHRWRQEFRHGPVPPLDSHGVSESLAPAD